MIEIEKTYLAKEIPSDLENCIFKEIIDVYIPKYIDHPNIRLRKNGDKFELTKKELVNDGDASHQTEQTIVLRESEFNTFNKQLEGKRVRKIRYNYNYNNRIAEFDVFQDELSGLVLIDFEFETLEEKDNFKMPDFCLADVTHEIFTAGGMICGKTYEDIKNDLKRFGYNKLYLT